jgi:hypothetical protein
LSDETAGTILAIVTLDMNRVGEGTPVFLVDDEEEQQRVAGYLSSILDANVHDLENGTLILVKH